MADGILFSCDDPGFIKWVNTHPTGWVLNIRRRQDPKYVVLHRATCRTLVQREGVPAGGFTSRGYRKVCAESVESLREWAAANGRPNHTFSKECSLCSAS